MPASWSQLATQLGDDLVDGLLEADQTTEAGIEAQRRVSRRCSEAGGSTSPEARAC